MNFAIPLSEGSYFRDRNCPSRKRKRKNQMSINNLKRGTYCALITASSIVPVLSGSASASPASASPASAAPASAAPASNQAHVAQSIGERGEGAYDNALAGKWGLVSQAARQLQSSNAQLPARWHGLRDQFGLSREVRGLQLAAASHNKWAAANAANRVTLFAARLEEPTKPVIPTEITLLDVYGRDLQVAGGRGDLTAARRALGSLDSTWVMIRPRVVRQGGTVAAKRFDFALHRALSAGSAQKMGLASTPVLDEVDSLEKVFTR